MRFQIQPKDGVYSYWGKDFDIPVERAGGSSFNIKGVMKDGTVKFVLKEVPETGMAYLMDSLVYQMLINPDTAGKRYPDPPDRVKRARKGIYKV